MTHFIFPDGKIVLIGIGFLENTGCHVAGLFLAGDTSSVVTLRVDGQYSFGIAVIKSRDVAGYPLRKDQLRSIKNGKDLELVTVQHTLKVSLNGVAAAINQAWLNCEALKVGGSGSGIQVPVTPAPNQGIQGPLRPESQAKPRSKVRPAKPPKKPVPKAKPKEAYSEEMTI